MIKLYRTDDCRRCDEFEERLRDLCLAHETESVRDGAEPLVEESGRTYRGFEAIAALLDELERELSFSRSISGDACYLDPDDPNRCI